MLFFKKFTETEAKQWETIAKKAEKDITTKYKDQTEPIEKKLTLRGKEAPTADEKKQLRKDLKAIKEKIANEIKAQIKTEFDYQIPIAEVEKAGISTTGAKIENELEPLAKEFTTYRVENKLWGEKFDQITYGTDDDGNFYRQLLVGPENIAQEPEIFYGK